MKHQFSPCTADLKSKTPQGIEPCPNRVRSATTGVFCFLLLLLKRAKAKPGGTKPEVCSSRKRKPLKHLAAILSPHGDFLLVTRLKLEERDNWFPQSPAFPHDTVLAYDGFHNILLSILQPQYQRPW